MNTLRLRNSVTKVGYILILICLLVVNSVPVSSVRAQATSLYSVIATIPVGTSPENIAINEVTNRVYVTNFDDNPLSVIDGQTNSILTTIDIGIGSARLSVNAITNRIFAAMTEHDTVRLIDGETNVLIASSGFGGSPGMNDLAVNPNNNRLYMVRDYDLVVWAYSLGGPSAFVASIPFTDNPSRVAINPNTNRIYTVSGSAPSQVTVIDGELNSIVNSIIVGNGANSIAVNLSTNKIYVGNGTDGTVSVIDGGSDTVIKTVTMPVTGNNSPVDIDVDTSKNLVFVAFAGGVAILDGATDTFFSEPVLLSGIVSGVAVNSSTNQVYVTNSSNNTVLVLGSEVTKLPVIDYFALGDSIASGHGLGDDGSACHRSVVRGYPWLVRNKLLPRYEQVNFPLEHWLACSGATALKPDKATLKQDSNKWFRNQVDKLLPQLTQLPSGRPTLVSITIGMNDFDWMNKATVFVQLNKSDALFAQWVNDTTSQVGNELFDQVARILLARPDAVIVITEYSNPFNETSIFFTAKYKNVKVCPDRTNCYERTNTAVTTLNGSFVSVWDRLGQPKQLIVASGLKLAFKGHESPQPSCGSSLPITADTWVQYIGDPNFTNFNSSLPDDIKKILGLPSGVTGDCFHPNDIGAAMYADFVYKDAILAGR